MWHWQTQDQALLARYPDLAPWMIFHASGHVREAAYDRLRAADIDGFLVAALFYGMNDWVPEVRTAASRAADRFLVDLAREAFAPLLPHVPLGMLRWQRGGLKNPVLSIWCAYPPAKELLVSWIETAAVGPASRLLGAVIADPFLDDDLARLSGQARHPYVRAAATKYVLQGKVTWSVGHKREWIDKSLGVSRLVPELKERPLTVRADTIAVARVAAKDRAVVVRRQVADWLIATEQTAQVAQVARLLVDDSDHGVKDRMAFHARKWGG